MLCYELTLPNWRPRMTQSVWVCIKNSKKVNTALHLRSTDRRQSTIQYLITNVDSRSSDAERQLKAETTRSSYVMRLRNKKPCWQPRIGNWLGNLVTLRTILLLFVSFYQNIVPNYHLISRHDSESFVVGFWTLIVRMYNLVNEESRVQSLNYWVVLNRCFIL